MAIAILFKYVYCWYALFSMRRQPRFLVRKYVCHASGGRQCPLKSMVTQIDIVYPFVDQFSCCLQQF